MTINESETIWAMVQGKPLTELPLDLFIPPDALAVLLETFTGPLDLLLYLIRRDDIDILDIPIVAITQQYMQYIAYMEKRCLNIAADYLVMAAMLAEIKSRLLLPSLKADDSEEENEDPRMLLVRKLQAYEQFKEAAISLDGLPRCERDHFRVAIRCDGLKIPMQHPDVALQSVVEAIRSLLVKAGQTINHQVIKDVFSVKEKMAEVLSKLAGKKRYSFAQLCQPEEGLAGLVVTFIALLELVKQSLIKLIQASSFSPFYVQAVQDD